METSGLAAAIDGLPERQRYVLVRRYGLGVDEKPATLAQLGDELEVSEARLRLMRPACPQASGGLYGISLRPGTFDRIHRCARARQTTARVRSRLRGAIRPKPQLPRQM